MVATDGIQHDGAAFPVLLPDQAHKHLGMRTTLTGDFSQEKARVTDEMRLRLSALRTDKMLPPILKEVAIKIGVVSVFRYSAVWSHGQRQSWATSPSRGLQHIIRRGRFRKR